MNPPLSVCLWLALLPLVCCEHSDDEDWDYYDGTEFNLTDLANFNWTDDFNLTDSDYRWFDYSDFSTSDFVHTSSQEDESTFRSEASGIGRLKPVFLLGSAILQIWGR